MPTVPIGQQGSASPSILQAQASPENLLMAAATMHEMGRLAPKGGKRKPPQVVK